MKKFTGAVIYKIMKWMEYEEIDLSQLPHFFCVQTLLWQKRN